MQNQQRRFTEVRIAVGISFFLLVNICFRLSFACSTNPADSDLICEVALLPDF